MEMESKFNGKNVALYFAGERPANPAECAFKGHTTQLEPSGPFREVLKVVDGEREVLLGRDDMDTYWVPLIRDPMSDEFCVRGRKLAFEIDIVP